ncbi:hypothetical protein [Tellurirhabdus bombi]|uniref:hypothetical protein n=1 Tax=Tellurirhabdus bombi TaxID=2907205 RepID=UPI001F1AFB57|nr:hypothetical protein [Tellurirhabdus bombi]
MLTDIYSNLLEVLYREQERLEAIKSGTPRNLRNTAEVAAELVRRRIQESGRNVAGVQMTTQARERLGKYSKYHGRTRQRLNLQVAQIDFTMNGNLMSAWGVLSSDADGSSVGFDNDEAAEIANHLEGYFGEAFGMTNDERNRAVNGFLDQVHETFNR